MPTIADSGVYKTASTGGKVVKTMTIPGQAGKQIKVESESVSLANGKEGIRTDLTIYMKYSNTKFAVSGWGITDTDYVSKSYDTYAYTGDVGKDVILQWVLKTGIGGVAKMKDASCVYSLIPAEEEKPTEEETPIEDPTVEGVKKYIVVECKESDIKNITAELKNIAPEAGINTCNKVE